MTHNDTLNMGQLLTGQDCLLRQDALTTHAAVLGMTGSGKTGLLLGMIEQLVENGIPVVLVDIKGDMINLALQSGTLAQKMAIRCLTPGAMHGESVNVFDGLRDSDKIVSSVTALLKMVGEDFDPIRSKAHSYLSEIMLQAHKAKKIPTLLRLVHKVQDPGFHHLGAMDLDYAFPKRSRTNLAGKLNNLLVAPSFQAWREGVGLSLDELLAPRTDGRTPVVVYSVSHLVNQDEQNFAIQLLLDEVLPWMRRQGGSVKLRTALVIDECVGLMPPHPKNPPTKTPLLLLLKQARAFGLGLILASQNPVDLDYKGMSNCQTWLIGRLQMGSDKARIIENICSSSSASKNMMENKIGSLQPRTFIMARPKGSMMLKTRTTNCALQGPMTPDEIAAMYPKGQLVVGDPVLQGTSSTLTLINGGSP